MQLLVIEDNPDLVANVADFLEGRGHTLDIAYNGYAGLGFVLENDYDALILDLMLPGIDGFEVCARLRSAGRAMPVLMFTARDGLEDKLEGFASGADDYLVKPFALQEMEARLLAMARRGGAAQPGRTAERLRVADLELDLATRRLTRAGQALDLPPIPMKLLELLMRRALQLVSRAELERAAWGDEPPDSDALRAHLHLLCQAIDKPFPHPTRRQPPIPAARDRHHPGLPGPRHGPAGCTGQCDPAGADRPAPRPPHPGGGWGELPGHRAPGPGRDALHAPQSGPARAAGAAPGPHASTSTSWPASPGPWWSCRRAWHLPPSQGCRRSTDSTQA